MPRTLTYVIPPEADEMSVQSFLRRMHGMSSRTLAKLKRTEHGLLLDGKHIRTIDRMRAGQTLTVTMPEDAVRIEGADIPLDIAYEDADILVVNKPPYLAVHPSAGKPDPTLANAVVAHFERSGTPHSFRPLNRLDRNTSGLLLAAKNAHTAYIMRTAAHKVYIAVVCGKLYGEGTINEPIRIKEGCTISREVGEGGKDSITHWRVLATGDDVSVVRLELETGRTHQIRVHMAWLGHPLVGDTMYGTDERLPRHALHCARMSFVHPYEQREVVLEAPIPQDMKDCIFEHGCEEALACPL